MKALRDINHSLRQQRFSQLLMQSIGKAVFWGESSGSLGSVNANQQEGLLAWLMCNYSFYSHRGQFCGVKPHCVAEATTLQSGMTMAPLL